MNAVELRQLTFAYPGETGPVLLDLEISIPSQSRCLVVGANGAGKTTLLHILAGKFMVDPQAVRVLGLPAFHDTSLAGRVTLLGGRFPFDVDVGVGEILERLPHLDSDRRDRVLRLLGIDVRWRMHRISDGQRRRVQIALGLVTPAELLLLDEVTTDLDLLARVELLALLREESERGATVLYATHIFDGLETWPTHVLHLTHGRLRFMGAFDALADERAGLRQQPAALFPLVYDWLRRYG